MIYLCTKKSFNMFTKSCEYAIKACIFVAQNKQEGVCVSIKSIAQGIKAPEHFIAKILKKLTIKKIMNSVKGPNGGYYMTEMQLHKPISEIVNEIDGDNLFTKCVLGLEYCDSSNPCPMHFEYMKIKNSIKTLLETNTILDFDTMVKSKKAFLIMN